MYEIDDDRYCYPGTTVLKNRYGARNQIDLDKLERLRFEQRSKQPLPRGRLSCSHYCAIHGHLFGSVYAWAGRYRQVRIAKDSSMFCYPENIRAQMRALFDEMQGQNRYRDLEAGPFARRAAHFLSDLNAIHPFREGNGRTQNIFIAILADQAGHPFETSRLDAHELFDATVQAFHGDERPLTAVILRALRA